MQLVIISDTHCHHRDLELPVGDVLIHCGDICHGHDTFDNRKMLLDLMDWMEPLDYGLKIVVAGNHDNVLEKDPEFCSNFSRKGITYLEDSSVTYKGKIFYGTPWQVPFWGSFNLPDLDILTKLRTCYGCDVFISHSPPLGILDGNSLDRSTGSESIKIMVENIEPSLHCFGHCHYHGSSSVVIGKTTYLNAASVGKDYSLLNCPQTFNI